MAYYQASSLYLLNFVELFQLFLQLKVFISLPPKFREKEKGLFGSTGLHDEAERNRSSDEDLNFQDIQQIQKIQKFNWNYKHLCSLWKWFFFF